MTLISSAIPNLVGGVSQQPPALRTSSSCAAMENAWPSVVSGLMKRQPTEFVKKLNTTVSNGAMCYVIDRDPTYRYMVLMTNSGLKVFDLDGNEQTVTFPNGTAYLTSANNPVDSFRFLTLGDTTFVLNRSVAVQANNYGELGELSSYTPDGTVGAVEELPAAPALNSVYLVTGDQTYYVYKSVPINTTTNQWVITVPWQATQPTGFTLVTALPTTVTLGAKYCLKRTTNTGAIQYQGYTGTAVTTTTYSNKWVAITLSELAALKGLTFTSSRLNPAGYATIYVTNAIPNAWYAIYINGVLKAKFLTKDNTSSTSAMEPTTVIAEQLANHTLAKAGNSGLTQNGITNYTVIGSTIVIGGLSKTDKVQAWTTNGDKSLKSYKDSVTSFSELPPNELTGRVVKIKGDPTDTRDEYFVQFNDNREWDECVAYNEGASIRNETMPHVLVREANGTWTFKKWEWNNRDAGDANSNPHPSFVGFKLNDIFVYSNRLGFISDENIILSEADTYENFYRTTLAQLLDSDPIDFAVLHNNVNILQHAVPFNKDVILFSDQNQFRFSYSNFLNAKNVQVKFTTSFNCARRTRPVNMGSSIYFSDDVSTSRYAKVWEYYPKDDLSNDDAEEATAPVPEYVPGSVRFFSGSTRVKALVVGTEKDPAALYVYKYFWAGDRKIQNAWGKWTFTDCTAVFWAGFVNNYLYLLLQRSDGLSLERMKFDEDVFTSNTDYEVLLDRRIDIAPNSASVAYNATTKISTITLPYSTSATVEVISFTPPVSDGINDSIRNAVTKVSANTFTIPGDARSLSLTIGIPYTFAYEFSTPYLKQDRGQGRVTVLDGRLQMRYMSLEYHNTAFFRTRVRMPGRNDFVNTFNGRVIGSAQTVLGQATFLTGTFRMPLMGRNTDLRFWIENDSPFPSTFGSAEWQAMYTPKSATRV